MDNELLSTVSRLLDYFYYNELGDWSTKQLDGVEDVPIDLRDILNDLRDLYEELIAEET